MSDIVISVQELSKYYRLGEMAPYRRVIRSLRHWLGRRRGGTADLTNLNVRATAQEEIWVLRDVSFDVKRGEVVGIIGRNGAGKSTLLKILSRITEPSRGCAEIRGRVGSLLEVGTGFHPELTGRENVYLNGAILGMGRAEVRSKFDEIVAFSGVERFLDTPVKRYSSGMRVRLAFAVAAHLEPEILIVDEVLAVGDAEFQQKCLGKMGNVAHTGRTVLFVSHNLGAVQTLCSRGIVLQDGVTVFDGETTLAVAKYMEKYGSSTSRYVAPRENLNHELTWLTAVSLHSLDGTEIDTLVAGGPLHVRFHYANRRPQTRLDCAIGIYNNTGQKLIHLASHLPSLAIASVRDARDELPPTTGGTITCRIPSLPLTPGRYHLNIYMSCDGYEVAYVQGALALAVSEPGNPEFGWGPAARTSAFLVGHQWMHELPDCSRVRS